MGVALGVIAVGAILAFAVRTSTGALDLHVVGYILMLTGLAALYLWRQNRPAWLRRVVVMPRRGRNRGGVINEVTYPPYVAHNPAALHSGAESNGPQPGDISIERAIAEEAETKGEPVTADVYTEELPRD